MDSWCHPRNPKKLFYYFPIVHASSDMGGLEQVVRYLSIQHSGREGWQHKKEIILQIWREIERALDALELNYPKIKIYQDGLPICSKKLNIIRDLAKLGSPNHLLVLKLVERGASLMATESAELLVQEYEVIKQRLDNNYLSGSVHRTQWPDEIMETLLTRHDEFNRPADRRHPGDGGYGSCVPGYAPQPEPLAGGGYTDNLSPLFASAS